MITRTLSALLLTAAVAQAAMSVSWQTNQDQSISLMSSADSAEWLVVGTVESVTGEGGLPAPVISGEYVVSTNSTSLQIAWDTDLTTAPNIIDYGTVDGEFGSTATATDGKHHSTTITGLTPGTEYQWRVRSFANSQWAISASHWVGLPAIDPPTPTMDLTNGMIAYFNFDDATFTNAVNGMPLTKAGTITNSSNFKVVGQAAGGWTGQNANYLSFPSNSAALSPTAGKSLFIAGWFRPGTTNARMGIVSKATTFDPAREWDARYDASSNTVAFVVYPNGTAASAVSVYASQNIPVSPANWYFFGVGYSVSANEIYATIGTTNIDTPLFTVRTNTVNFGSGITTTRLVSIGQTSGGAFPFNGRKDDTAFWSRVPSWLELEAYRTNTIAGRSYPNLLP